MGLRVTSRGIALSVIVIETDSVPDPTPAEVAATVAAAAAPSDPNDTLLRDDADSLDGVSVASAAGVSVTGPAIDSQLDADIVSSDSGWGLGTVVWTARLLLSGGLSRLKSSVFFLVPWLHQRITGGRLSLLWSMSCSCGVKGPFLIVRNLLLLMHWLYLESGMSCPWFTCPLLFYVNQPTRF